MAFDRKDKIIGGLALGLVGAISITYYGTQFDHTTGSRDTRIAGEMVEIKAYENKWFGGGQHICVDGTCYGPSAYKNRLNDLVDKALEEQKE